MSGVKGIGCIGAGYWGKNLVRNFYDLGVLSWVCEVDAGLRRQLSREYPGINLTDNIDDVLSDDNVAGVAVASPAATHGKVVMQALDAAKDVFVEKPLSLLVDEAVKLIDRASEQKNILMVGHLLWYHPAILKLKEWVNKGHLGRIQYIYSNRLNFGKIRREENILWSFAPHDVSVVLGLVGETPDGIWAKGGNFLHDQIADVTVSTLSFPSGVKAHIFVSWLHPFKEQKLVIVGDRKMAVFNDTQKEQKLVVYPHAIQWKNGFPIPKKADAQAVPIDMSEPLRNECIHFLDCIRTRATPRTDGLEGLRVLRVLRQCQDALEDRSSNYVHPKGSALVYTAHESAFIDDNATIGEGTAIWHVSHIMSGVSIGRNCRIGQNVVIGPDVRVGNGVKIQNNVSVYQGVTLEDNVFCGPSMVFTNVHNPRSEIRRMDEMLPTIVREGATLGANCTIVCGHTIGRYAFVGAGTVVLRDVPDFALVVGNPGRVIGWMCVCGNRLHVDSLSARGSCTECGRLYVEMDGAIIPYEEHPPMPAPAIHAS